MRRIYGILILAGAAILWLTALGYLGSTYDRPPMMSESQIEAMDAETAAATRRQIESTESTLITVAWISFSVATLFAGVMVVLGGRLLLFG